MIKHKKRKIYFGLFWFFLVLSFILFASFLVFMANGYHLNTSTLKLEKTGMVVVNGKIAGVTLILNGQEKKVDLPTRLNQLFPGQYSLIVKKENYYNYQKSFQLSGGQAVVIDNLTLFLTDPKIVHLSSNDQTIAQIKKNNTLQSNQFILKNNEIWKNNKLITRFSQVPIAAIYDANTDHYFVQLNDGIHAILGDGSNNVLLVKLEKNTPVIMAINGSSLSYIIEDKIYQTQLW